MFSGMLGATRAVSGEGENGCIRALLMSPIDRAALYAAKLAAAFIFMAVAEAALDYPDGAVLQSRIRRRADAPGARSAAWSARLRRAGDAAGRRFPSRLRGGDLLLPLLAVPMFVPALIAGVKASAAALAGAPLARVRDLAQSAPRFRRHVHRRRLPAVRICRRGGLIVDERGYRQSVSGSDSSPWR